ncbi:MAG: hypothetical protein C4523_16090 [Myxococcales bacterium]|nr:MAG: hypothetical protein C4523_16090 [Myxococcales bacterium]
MFRKWASEVRQLVLVAWTPRLAKKTVSRQYQGERQLECAIGLHVAQTRNPLIISYLTLAMASRTISIEKIHFCHSVKE